jgi:hypothetical protein
MQFRDIYNRLHRYDVPEVHHHFPVPSTGLDGTSDDIGTSTRSLHIGTEVVIDLKPLW